MYKQSSLVLALFLGAASARVPPTYSYFATGMNGDEDLGEDITMKGDHFHYVQKEPVIVEPPIHTNVTAPPKESIQKNGCAAGETKDYDGYCTFEGTNILTGQDNTEKVHVLDPKIAREHTTFYNKKQNVDALVQLNSEPAEEPKPAAKTTFYDKVNGVWKLVFAEVDLDKTPHPTPSVAGPEQTDQIGTSVHDKAVEGGDAIANERALQVNPISPVNYDPWVFEFSSDSMSGISYQHAQKTKKDIGEHGIEENVHWFANDQVDVLPNTRKEGAPYDYNGSGPKAHHNAFFQKSKKDIGEHGIEENVHWFANDQVDVLPNTRKEGSPYDYNGSGPKAHHSAFLQKGDIANTEVRPDVYETVSRMVNPTPLWRSDVPPEKRNNGNFDYQGARGIKPTSF